MYNQEGDAHVDDEPEGDHGEILDELTTSRGEFKIRTLSFENPQVRTCFIQFLLGNDVD